MFSFSLQLLTTQTKKWPEKENKFCTQLAGKVSKKSVLFTVTKLAFFESHIFLRNRHASLSVCTAFPIYSNFTPK